MYLYMLRCEGNALYTGITKDVKKRIFAHYHKTKAAAKYTKSHSVLGLAAVWFCKSDTDARKLEWAIKALTKEQKTALTENPESIKELFPEFSAEVVEINFEECI